MESSTLKLTCSVHDRAIEGTPSPPSAPNGTAPVSPPSLDLQSAPEDEENVLMEAPLSPTVTRLVDEYHRPPPSLRRGILSAHLIIREAACTG